MAHNVGLQPFKGVSWTSVATSLNSTETVLPKWLADLDPKRALQNALAIVSHSSRNAHTFAAIALGFGSLGTGFYIYVWKNVPLRNIISWLSSKFIGSVSIAANHPINKDVLTFMEKEGLGRKATSLALVNPNVCSDRDMMYSMYSKMSLPQPVNRAEGRKAGEPDPELLEYIPTSGSYAFWHGGHRMTLTRADEVTGYYKEDGEFVRTQNGPSDMSRGQTLTISCWSLGAGVRPIKAFLEHVREVTKPTKHNTTTIFRASCHKEQQKFNWDVGVNRPARTVDSIALESKMKSSLMRECTRYFSKEDERFHACRGIPYRRGLLFYGPPGTGKTSFTVALAGHFKLNVYMISMSDEALNDRGLGKLFEALPKRCIVLLEDIDSSVIERVARKETIKSSRDPMKPKKTVLVGVTLSGLLNVLDGPASVDGRLVVMTSNTPDSLDAALIRPGRIDSKILFGYANREVTTSLFLHIFTKTADELATIAKGSSAVKVDEEDERAIFGPSPDILQKMAEQFSACIPETKISPAEVQGFLMRHRDDPKAALENAKAWVTETLEVKEKGKNVADFDNEIKRGAALFTGRGSEVPPKVNGHEEDPFGSELPLGRRARIGCPPGVLERHRSLMPMPSTGTNSAMGSHLVNGNQNGNGADSHDEDSGEDEESPIQSKPIPGSAAA